MFLIIGVVVVFASVFGGYVAMGGHLAVLWQPFEGLIILGSAAGNRRAQHARQFGSRQVSPEAFRR